jgi:transposase InsO family protein
MTGRWRFISEHHEEYGIQRLCRILRVSRSGFYRWRVAEPAHRARSASEAELTERIRGIHAAAKGAYGVPRTTRELRETGPVVNHKRVTRLMRAAGITGRHLRKGKRTTVQDVRAPKAPDLLERDFTAPRPDVRWCGDITCLPVGKDWMYLATVIDIHSRRVVGYSMAGHMRADLVVDALEAAVATRGGSVEGVIFHSDRGTQYTWGVLASACRKHGIHRSMGRVGSSYDNAMAESFFASIKREILHGERWLGNSEARMAVFSANHAHVPQVRLADLYDWVQEYGYAVKRIPLAQWPTGLPRSADVAATTDTFFDSWTGSSSDSADTGPVRTWGWAASGPTTGSPVRGPTARWCSGTSTTASKPEPVSSWSER